MDEVGIIEETLHSIKIRRSLHDCLKIDLEKAYDKVNWTMLRLILLQIGIPFSVVRWIMACVTSASFAVLVNGSDTTFLQGTRGIHQGFPLSPHLFLLIIEGLSLLINQAKRDKKILGIKVAGSIFISHIFFVDDVILFGDSSLLEWMHYKSLIDLFCGATRMTINTQKSAFGAHNITQTILSLILQSFTYICRPLEEG